MTDGLKDAHREAIIAVIAANDRVERAVLFGSRATGTNTVSSDVDIALVGDRLTLSDQARLSAALDELPMAQSVDLLLYASIKNRTLLTHIGRDGIELYRRPNRLHDRCPQGIDDCQSEEWTERAFDEVIDFREGPGILARDFREEGVPLVRLAGLGSGASILQGCDYLSPEAVERRWTQFRLAQGDVLLSSSAALGRIAIVGREGIGAIPYTGIIRMRPRDGSLYAPFIRYLLEGPDFQRQADMVGVGSVIRHFGPTHLRQMTIPVPPISDQRAIAHILGMLDDKIELNRRMNATLEAMARALFRSWFVDFDPVRAKMEGRDTGLPQDIADLFPDRLVDSELGEIPEGWQLESLDAVARFQNGLALQKCRPSQNEARLPVVKIAQLRAGEANSGEWASASIKPECIIEDGDVVFSWSGSLLVRTWCGGRAALNQHLFRVTSEKYPKWFYLHCILSHFPEFRRIAADKATTMGHIKRHHLTDAVCVVPPNRLLIRVSGLLGGLLDRGVANEVASRTLVSLRDALLPELVSGELRVTGLEPANVHVDRPASVGTHEA